MMMTEFEKRLTAVRPSERQLRWQETEFYAFVHYGVNQFTDREWGDGRESPAIFNPLALDTDQWCGCFRSAGMKGVILTAKHHDGFCLWDTKLTDHSVMYSPYGKDILARLADSCRAYGLKLGVYLSPWDRHDSRYGHGDAYNDYFCGQLTELLTGYGEIFSCWFDGACGEGANGKKQIYDWGRFYEIIRRLQPGAAISVCGPDVRWCGNEAGHCRESEWSVVPAGMADNEKIHASSQQTDDAAFHSRIPSNTQDLGSRDALKDVCELAWYPAEVNTSIRPGWFYHAAEDDKVRSLDELKSIYIQSAGGNATFLLNVPPHPQGYIAAPDAKRLREMGDWLRGSFTNNLLSDAKFTASSAGVDGHGPEKLNQPGGYWKASCDGGNTEVVAELPRAVSPRYLTLREEIAESQRVERFALYRDSSGVWEELCRGTVVGYKRICPLPDCGASNRWKLAILASRGGAALSTFALY